MSAIYHFTGRETEEHKDMTWPYESEDSRFLSLLLFRISLQKRGMIMAQP